MGLLVGAGRRPGTGKYRVVGAHVRNPGAGGPAELAAALTRCSATSSATPPQGTAFEVGISARDGWVAVRVDDAGPGIPTGTGDARGESNQGSTGLAWTSPAVPRRRPAAR
jgi:hypothetical protein